MCKKEKQTFDFVAMEHDILKLWEDQQFFDRLREKNTGNQVFRFLDGPITANNPMGVHHAWGRSMKDTYLRYKAMNGYDCHYQNGFDTQGLWVEVEVEKELGFADKEDIRNYGLEAFTDKCIERIHHFAGRITKQSKRLGQWMDWENSYYTHKDENIAGIWHFLKKCHDAGWIVKYHKPMPWCPRCGTSLSAHEMSGSYKQITHQSVFFHLPVIGEAYDMLVWTTTPWTLAANVALAVNPDIEYVRVQVAGHNRPLVLAKNAQGVMDGYDYKVEGTFSGSTLLGKAYETCFPQMGKQQGVEHRVIPWSEVNPTEGTGIVHIAPGCGEEDYELGQSLGLTKIQPVDESGVFLYGFGDLTGRGVKDVRDQIFAWLKETDKLFQVMDYEHSYPVCWRCKTEVIYRLVEEWYIKSDEVRPRLIEAARQVEWEPVHMGKRMEDWLTNMGDWNISRKRFYGLPLPFYVCEGCGELTVLGSVEELEEYRIEKTPLPHLHRPWIDQVRIRCPHCGEAVSRVPDIGDVWLDAGIVPFSTRGYFSDKEGWRKYFPAEWITEMREQVRLWFYSMLYMGVVLEGRAPYEKVLAYNMVVSEDGSKFSKTGFMIPFDEAAEKMGSDAIRYLFGSTHVSNEVRFGYGSGAEANRKLRNLYQVYSFFNMYAHLDQPKNLGKPMDPHSLNPMDRWLASRTAHFLQEATEAYDSYRTMKVLESYEHFIDDLSNWYIRVNRRRFWKAVGDESKDQAYRCLYDALKTAVLVLAPVAPFLTEYIWQQGILPYEKDEDSSVHLASWPSLHRHYLDGPILEEMGRVRKITAMVLRLRNEKQLKVRQPLGQLYLVGNEALRASVKPLEGVIMSETNIKSITWLEDRGSLQEGYLVLDFRKAGKSLGKNLPVIKAYLDGATKEEMNDLVGSYDQGQSIQIEGVQVEAVCFQKAYRPLPDILLGEEEGILMGLSTKLTKELRYEGYMRDILRYFQVFRKELGYDLDQRIKIMVQSEDVEIQEVAVQYKDYLEEELLARTVFVGEEEMACKTFTIDGKKVTIRCQLNAS